MSVLDKLVAAVTPEASAQKKQEARDQARAAAVPGDWLSLVLDHHLELEACFEAVRSATSAVARREAQDQLATLLTAHSIAEEAVLYPAMALGDQKKKAGELYTEQSAAKVQIAALRDMDPMSQDYLDKLEHLRAAVSHHMHEEESECFVQLQASADPATRATLSTRYRAEYQRYVGAADRSFA